MIRGIGKINGVSVHWNDARCENCTHFFNIVGAISPETTVMGRCARQKGHGSLSPEGDITMSTNSCEDFSLFSGIERVFAVLNGLNDLRIMCGATDEAILCALEDALYEQRRILDHINYVVHKGEGDE